IALQADFQKLASTPNKINLVEYVRNGLFDLDRFTAEERADFLSNDLHWPIANKCNKTTWSGAAEDKVLAHTILTAGGIRVPNSVAVIDRTPRQHPGLVKIADVAGLRAVLAKESGGRLFAKIVDGMVSFGAFRIDGSDATHIHCAGHPPMTHEEFLDSFVGDNVYLVQRELTNHEALTSYASALATVRMVNLVTDAGVHVPFALIKLPQGDNIADAFWRPGNLACDIDVETGRIQTVTRRGIETEHLDDHPEAAGLKGLELPFWAQLKELNARAAALYAPIRYQSTDIAITADGPVVVELNYGGGFDLPQYASGRGLLTSEVRAFFDACGVELGADAVAKKKKGFLSFGRS
ncbi:MAG: sugar-transfer associated ATP-grasp domain-containing protein, partial [Pseudomonadota bacterium]